VCGRSIPKSRNYQAIGNWKRAKVTWYLACNLQFSLFIFCTLVWHTRALKISAAMSLLKWNINMARRRLGWHPNGSREAPCLSYTCLGQVFSFGNKQLCYVLTSNSDIVIKNNCSKITRNLDRSWLNKLKPKIYLNASKNNHFCKNQELLPWITNGCHRR